MMRKTVLGIGLFGMSLLWVRPMLAVSGCDGAGNCYVRQGATGSGSGADWTNACTDFVGNCAGSSLIRGATYFVATGSYVQLILNTPDSGLLVTTILGATAANHGTNTGWQNSYSVSTADGGGPASFSSVNSGGSNQCCNIVFRTDHWVFDGAVGTGNTLSSFGFMASANADCTVTPQQYVLILNNAPGSQTDVTIRHVAIDGSACRSAGTNVSSVGFELGCSDGTCPLSNVDITNVYTENLTQGFGISDTLNSTFEHSFFELFYYAGSNSGKEVVATDCSGDPCSGKNGNNTFRYNIVKNCGQPSTSSYTGGIIGLGPGGTESLLNWSIYGNVFVDCGGNSGTIAGINGFEMVGVVMYNNTFINSHMIVLQCQGPSPCATAGGNIFENNLLVNSTSDVTGGIGSAVTADYNTFWSPTDTPPSETHGQTPGAQACPLVNCAIDSTGNYHLTADAAASCSSTAATCTGLTLPSPFNMDPDGNTRGADGTWERGAYEFSSSVSAPSQPSNLTPTPH